jgi:hypothetical protein
MMIDAGSPSLLMQLIMELLPPMVFALVLGGIAYLLVLFRRLVVAVERIARVMAASHIDPDGQAG